jgi:8-oxo-dGTP pyrophosphatase MutT (NUDIX family)
MSEREAGVAVIVWRRSFEVEVLLLHRSRFGVEFDGDWAWATPGGGRKPGEKPQDAAQRELREETGLSLACMPVVAQLQRDMEVAVFVAEAPTDAEIQPSDEHDATSGFDRSNSDDAFRLGFTRRTRRYSATSDFRSRPDSTEDRRLGRRDRSKLRP